MLSPDCLVTQDTAVGPEDGLLAPGETSLLLVGGGFDSLQLEAGHWALGHRWALLQILKIKEF